MNKTELEQELYALKEEVYRISIYLQRLIGLEAPLEVQEEEPEPPREPTEAEKRQMEIEALKAQIEGLNKQQLEENIDRAEGVEKEVEQQRRKKKKTDDKAKQKSRFNMPTIGDLGKAVTDTFNDVLPPIKPIHPQQPPTEEAVPASPGIQQVPRLDVKIPKKSKLPLLGKADYDW